MRPPDRVPGDPAIGAASRAIEIWSSFRVRRISSRLAVNRCDGCMEPANPDNRLGSHAEVQVELRDQMPSAAAEFLGKPCQIYGARIFLEHPPYPLHPTEGEVRKPVAKQ